MNVIIASLIAFGGKIADIFNKKAKSGEKAQDIEIKKINAFSKGLIFIFVGTFLMCVLASLFPKLAITPYWFEVLDKLINYALSN